MVPKSARVMIVDDDKLNINMLNDILKDDYLVKAARNGVQALKRAVSPPQPDLILLDIEMPEMDGFEVCRQLKQNPETRDIPILFVTAHTVNGCEEWLKSGAE